MKLHVSTIYAVQILGYMARRNNTLTTSKDVVENLGLTYQYSMKVMNFMKKSGILMSEQGCKGGFRMLRAANRLSVYDIICIFEGEPAVCKGYSEKIDAADPIYEYLEDLQEKEITKLKQTSIEDIYLCH